MNYRDTLAGPPCVVKDLRFRDSSVSPDLGCLNFRKEKRARVFIRTRKRHYP